MTQCQQTEIQRFVNDKDFIGLLNSPGIINKLLLVHVELDGISVSKTLNDELLAIGRDAEFMGQIAFCRLNADDFFDLLNTENINIAPTILYYYRTKIIDRVVGFDRIQLLKKIKYHLNTIGISQNMDLRNSDSILNSEQKLKSIINSAAIVMFIKGTPTNPQCGFSRQACHLLDENQIKYEYFDVLADHNIRELLKKYSNCPTYPQVNR